VGGGDQLDDDQARDLGPTRLAFWDAPLCSEWVERIGRDNLLFTEVKTENQIDRIAGVG
jgi:CRISPR-associated protein Csm3